MKLPASSRLIYRLLSRSDEDKKLLTILDTNPINREFFPNGALSDNQIPAMIERFIGGYEIHKTPIFLVFDKANNFIGRVGLFYTEELDAIGIGYFVDRKCWGKGYASEMTKTLLCLLKKLYIFIAIIVITKFITMYSKAKIKLL